MTRRALLASLPLGLAHAAVQTRRVRQLPQVGEFVRLLDPVTENTVVRLTGLASASRFPVPSNRFVSSRERFLVFSSDRTGKFQPYRLDLRTGFLQMLADTKQLQPSSLCLTETEHSLLLIDGSTLNEISLLKKTTRKVAEDVTNFAVGRDASELLLVRRGQLEDAAGNIIVTDVTGECLLRPGGGGCLFVRQAAPGIQEFWYAPLNASNGKKPFLLASGTVSFPYWSPDGQSLLFLRNVERNGSNLSEIHQVAVDSCSEQPVTPTSQFAAFSPNRDASVFVGSSRSKAQPNIVIVLRSAKREMTLCEHHASDPTSVAPVFAPDSRRVYFESDREGKSALYSINVELLVEPT